MSVTRATGIALLSAALLMLHVPAASAQEETTASDSVPLYSGGIGDDELNYIRSIQNQYDVKLLFTENNGAYLSDLSVTIMDKTGQAVVSTVTKGPFLLVNLPAGSYTVTATQGDASKEQKISVAGKGLHSYQFRFAGHDLVSSDN